MILSTMRPLLSIFLIIQLFATHTHAQTSIYLSSDKDIYIAGENLWYSAFILDPTTTQLSDSDHILYLQLITTNTDSTVWKEMYPIVQGTSSGHVYLFPTLPEGEYVIRAFTAHSFFRHQEVLFYVKRIQIVKHPSAIKKNRLYTPGDAREKLTVQITTNKSDYTSKELVTLKITTTDPTGKPAPAVICLSVYDALFNNAAMHHDFSAMLPPANKQPILPDSIPGQIISKKIAPQSLMLFNYNRSITQVTSADSKGKFSLSPANLSISQRVFIKYFSEKEQTIRIADPFDSILAANPANVYNEDGGIIMAELPPASNNLLQYNNLLKEIVIQSKGRQFSDPYFGYLDSIAKFEGNFDYVGQCGWLNCPACGSGTKPIEGMTYSELKPDKKIKANSHPFPFGADDYEKKPYHYPKYTEEELLKKFKMVITKGFYQHAPFYTPDYATADKQVSDTRNVLYWNPLILTNENGEATIQFYTSDIQSSFTIIATAVGINGNTGSNSSYFHVE